MTDQKTRAKAALDGYLRRQLKKDAGPTRKNKSPERDFVKGEVLPWLKMNGFDVNVVEAKAVYNVKAGRYMTGQTDAGLSDIVGNDRDGMAVFLEIKAPGKRGVIRNKKHWHQREFLLRKIETNCFAGCFDSIEDLDRVYQAYKDKDFHKVSRMAWMANHLVR